MLPLTVDWCALRIVFHDSKKQHACNGVSNTIASSCKFKHALEIITLFQAQFHCTARLLLCCTELLFLKQAWQQQAACVHDCKEDGTNFGWFQIWWCTDRIGHRSRFHCIQHTPAGDSQVFSQKLAIRPDLSTTVQNPSLML